MQLTGAFSTFLKHLLRDRLWRTLFFHPVGAFLKQGKCSNIHAQISFTGSALWGESSIAMKMRHEKEYGGFELTCTYGNNKAHFIKAYKLNANRVKASNCNQNMSKYFCSLNTLSKQDTTAIILCKNNEEFCSPMDHMAYVGDVSVCLVWKWQQLGGLDWENAHWSMLNQQAHWYCHPQNHLLVIPGVHLQLLEDSYLTTCSIPLQQTGATK